MVEITKYRLLVAVNKTGSDSGLDSGSDSRLDSVSDGTLDQIKSDWYLRFLAIKDCAHYC